MAQRYQIVGDYTRMLTVGTNPADALAAALSAHRDADTLAAAIASATEASTSGTNYTRKALTSAAWSVDETNDRADFDYGDVSYTGLNCGTVTGAIVYGVIAGGDANCIPLSFHTTGFPLITNGGNVTITINGLWRSS